MVETVDNTPMRVFDEDVLNFLGDVSSELLRSPVGRLYPDITAFAFYIRKANLLKLKDQFGDATGRVGRGLCFHVAPANIPINFAFSWVFALLAGNANIVRLPSKDFPQVTALLEVVTRHLDRTIEQSNNLKSKNVFVRYPRTENETTAAYCSIADCRMIWGGDRTIAGIKALSTRPRCVDVTFADRYSVAMINAEEVLAVDETRLQRLVQDFYNDTYLMDQNACSSPQIILWEAQSDSQTIEKAKVRFWNAVYALAEKKYVLQDAVAVDKYTLFCEESINNPAVKFISRRGNLLYRVDLTSLRSIKDLTMHRGKAGFFFEYTLTDRQEFFDVVTEKFQTITQFGVNVHELREQIVAHHLRGIDRIVPVGKAMDIGVAWDGYDLVRLLSRQIVI